MNVATEILKGVRRRTPSKKNWKNVVLHIHVAEYSPMVSPWKNQVFSCKAFQVTSKKEMLPSNRLTEKLSVQKIPKNSENKLNLLKLYYKIRLFFCCNLLNDGKKIINPVFFVFNAIVAFSGLVAWWRFPIHEIAIIILFVRLYLHLNPWILVSISWQCVVIVGKLMQGNWMLIHYLFYISVDFTFQCSSRYAKHFFKCWQGYLYFIVCCL